MHIVITGAAGTVGQCVTVALRTGNTLTLLDRNPHPTEPTVGVDLADFDALCDALPAADAMVHLGATPTDGDPQRIVRDNVLGTVNCFEAARIKGIGRMVFVSSLQAYGGGVALDGDETCAS